MIFIEIRTQDDKKKKCYYVTLNFFLLYTYESCQIVVLYCRAKNSLRFLRLFLTK